MVTAGDLRRASLAELERIYAEAAPLQMPAGCHHARHLAWTDSGRRSPWRPLLTLPFSWAPFGVDFDRRLWFFGHPALALGRFEPRVGPSRWRETETVGLFYHPSRLPGPVRAVLYDEVKPLSPGLCLGLGGVNGPPGRGDLFFFSLQRRDNDKGWMR